jgi:hypothetical protein
MEVTDEFANALYVLHINAEKPKRRLTTPR